VLVCWFIRKQECGSQNGKRMSSGSGVYIRLPVIVRGGDFGGLRICLARRPDHLQNLLHSLLHLPVAAPPVVSTQHLFG